MGATHGSLDTHSAEKTVRTCSLSTTSAASEEAGQRAEVSYGVAWSAVPNLPLTDVDNGRIDRARSQQYSRFEHTVARLANVLYSDIKHFENVTMFFALVPKLSQAEPRIRRHNFAPFSDSRSRFPCLLTLSHTALSLARSHARSLSSSFLFGDRLRHTLPQYPMFCLYSASCTQAGR